MWVNGETRRKIMKLPDGAKVILYGGFSE